MFEKKYDDSYLESRYFINGRTYNCPYCNMRNVQYQIEDSGRFDWSRERVCYFYVVECTNCGSQSLHLSNYEIVRDPDNHSYFYMPPRCWSREGEKPKAIQMQKNQKLIELLDDAFFYHQPTSFFTVDNRIPKIIRDLISEADGCRKMAYLVGASGCLRKAIYELLEMQGIPKEKNRAELSYEERIKQLKGEFSNIDPEYFDVLTGIQGMTSDNLHEGSWDSFDLSAFTLLLETTREILYEIYVLPDERKSRKSRVQQLREHFNKKTKNDVESPGATAN